MVVSFAPQQDAYCAVLHQNPNGFTVQRAIQNVNRSSRESLVKGLNAIDTLVSELGLNSTVQSRTTELYRKAAQTEDILAGRGIEQIAAGCLILAVRESSSIVDTQDVVDLTNEHTKEKTLHRITKDLRNELDIGFALEDPHKYIDPIANDLNATDHDRELAETIVDITLEDGIASGKKAQTIAGTAYYVVSVLGEGDGSFTQNEVSKAADITEVTIRNTYRDFAEVAVDELDSRFNPNKHRSTN